MQEIINLIALILQKIVDGLTETVNLKAQVADLQQQLATALGNDVADAAAIADAQTKADQAALDLATANTQLATAQADLVTSQAAIAQIPDTLVAVQHVADILGIPPARG